MPFTTRGLAAAAVIAAGLTLSVTPAAHAVVDPAYAIPCAAEAAGGVAALVDPAAPQAPSEIPAANCLQPHP
jgi:hypothetical protein